MFEAIKQVVGKMKDMAHFLFALLGALIFRYSRSIFILGVTGTKGKSTVLELINSILERAGKKTALLSSVRIKTDRKNERNLTGNTMPGRFFIHRFLKEAAEAGCDYALIEVTSQGILQHRHRFINWDAALFTNLAPEHIEAHGSFEKYREAKLSFFRYVGPKLFFINKDDANAGYFEKAAGKEQIIFYSKEDLTREGFILPRTLPGDFNKENIAAALAFAKSQGVDVKAAKNAVEFFSGVSGRMEFIFTEQVSSRIREKFVAVIDYAHTPDSLEKVYKTLKESDLFADKGKKKLICVLGSAGGGRDKWKRPVMGGIAAKYCYFIILTNEDPYDEKPEEIIRAIKSGVTGAQFPQENVFEIVDRREAIKKAVSLAGERDVVVLTGKGSESSIHLTKGEKMPWNEKRIVMEILKEKTDYQRTNRFSRS